MATAIFECPECQTQIRDTVLPEVPECPECDSYMHKEVPGTRQGELSMGMQRDLHELSMEQDWYGLTY